MPIVSYIEKQYADYLSAERKADARNGTVDTRVHVVLYFVQPSGHRLKPLDIAFLRLLCTKANVVPIIAKADTFLPDELSAFKKKVRSF